MATSAAAAAAFLPDWERGGGGSLPFAFAFAYLLLPLTLAPLGLFSCVARVLYIFFI